MIFRGESDSGVETGVRNPEHGPIWAFLGTTLHLRFFQHRVNRKKISPLGKNPSRPYYSMLCVLLKNRFRKFPDSVSRNFFASKISSGIIYDLASNH